MAELKKCPFCGGEAFLYQSGNTSCGFFGEVICKKCGVRTERVYKNLAIKVWNNRPTESEIRAKAIDEFAEKLLVSAEQSSIRLIGYKADLITLDYLADLVTKLAEQLKEE